MNGMLENEAGNDMVSFYEGEVVRILLVMIFERP